MSRYDSDDDYDFGGGGDTFSSGTTQASSRPSGGTTSVHTPVLTRPGYDSPIDDQQHEDGTVDTGEASFLGSAQDDVSIPATHAHPLGFVVKDCGGAHIDSVWKERIPHSDFSCQTKAINAMDQATSTFMRSSKLTQTENDEAQQLELESACTGLEVLLALGAHQRHLVLLETFASALPRPCVKYSGWSTSDTISPVRFCAEVKGKTGTSMCKST